MILLRSATIQVFLLISLVTLSAHSALCPPGNDLATPDADLLDNQDGTVSHAKTGLMWKQCSEGLSGAGCSNGTPNYLTWAEALSTATVANLDNFAGHSDWRLPNRAELESIVETGCYSPSVNVTRFPNIVASAYWTSTSKVAGPAQAWFVGFAQGDSGVASKANHEYVLLVRGGQSFGSFDALTLGTGCTLDIDGNHSIDALTDGLLIMRAMFGLTGTAVTNGAVGATPSRSDWQSIRTYLNANCGTNFPQ